MSEHLRQIVPPPSGAGDANVNGKKAPPIVSVAAVMGGMSAQKQKRVLERGVDVLIATPGRLWDLLQEVRAQLRLSRLFIPSFKLRLTNEKKLLHYDYRATISQTRSAIFGSLCWTKRIG